MSEEQTQWLHEFNHEIQTQDTRHTSMPLYVVYEKERIPTSSDYSYDGCEYQVDDELYDTYDEAQDSIIEDNSDNEDFDESEVEDMIQEHYYVEVDRFLTACFTMKAAQEFIDARSYAYKKPHIFIESLYYNCEMQNVLSILASLDKKD